MVGSTLMGHPIHLITHPEDNGVIGQKEAFSDERSFLAGGMEGFFGPLHEPTVR